MWQKISGKFDNVKVRKGKFPMGFFGWLPCKKAKIPKLDIAGFAVKNADVIIQNIDSETMFESYISMKYFKKTVVVLDFKRKLMWIKKTD